MADQWPIGDNHPSVTGRLVDRDGNPMAGARVEFRNREGQAVAKPAHTGPDGKYTLAAPGDVADQLTLIATSCDGSELVSKRDDPEAFQHALPELVVPTTRRRKFVPHRPTAQRLTGGILNEGRVALLDQAVRGLPGIDEAERARFRNLALCPAPDIYEVDDLLDLSWRVIDGEPGAVRSFRSLAANLIERHLDGGGQPHTTQPGARAESEPTTRILAYSTPEYPLPTPSHACLIGPDRFAPVGAATVLASRSAEEFAYLASGIETGLCGLDRFTSLVIEAERFLVTGNPDGFRSALDRVAIECGPDDGPPRPGCNPRPVPDDCFIERANCLAAIADSYRTRPTDRYHISAVNPVSACPGEVIILNGSGFGDDAGLVCFENNVGGSICVEAETWSDNRVTVEVPDGVPNGVITLKISEGAIDLCGRLVPLYRQGTGIGWEGGPSSIVSLTVDGRFGLPCFPPGQRVALAWSANPDDADVEVVVTDGVSELFRATAQPAVGRAFFDIPDGDTPETYEVTVTASGSCLPASATREFQRNVVPELTIEGMEVTQGIQVFWRDNVVWNTLNTISGKNTIVRVYVACERSGFNNDLCESVTGTLTVGNTVLTPVNGMSPIDDPSGSNPFITARPVDQIDREETEHTLNFLIPAALSNGTKRLRAAIFAPNVCANTIRTSLSMDWTWTDEPALQVRFVRVRDGHATAGTNSRPTAAECRFTLERGFDLLPSPATDIGPARVEQFNTTRDITTNNGLRGLLGDLDDEHNCSFLETLLETFTNLDVCGDEDAIWVGLTTPFNRGWAFRPGNTAMSAEYERVDGPATANCNNADFLRLKTGHEIGHNLSLRHVNRTCSGAPGGPFYNHPNNGQLVDVPFDPFWNIAISGTVGDVMGYDSVRWASGDTWTRLQAQI